MGDIQVTGVEGLRDLARDLKRVDPVLAKKLQQANKTAASHVADEGTRRYSAQYERRSGRGAGSIRALATAQRAQVAFGSDRAPYVAGQEFGSNEFRQFYPWTGKAPGGKGSMGRFIYPAIRSEADDLPGIYADLLDEALGENGFEK